MAGSLLNQGSNLLGLPWAACVNPKQVHVMGTAWTGPIAENLACAASDKIASFISAPNEANDADCTPERPVPCCPSRETSIG